VTGSTLSAEFFNSLSLVADVVTLLPKHINYETDPVASYSWVNPNGRWDSNYNYRDDQYVRNELEMVAKKCLSLRNRRASLEAFLAERREMSTKMMQVWPFDG